MEHYYNYPHEPLPHIYAPIYTPPPPTRYPVWFMPVVFLVNVGLFIYTMYENNCPHTAKKPHECLFQDTLGRFAFEPLHENHMFGPSTNTLIKMGALKANVVQHEEYWRFFASMWLHGGLVHLLVNMMGLLLLGNSFESDFGFWRIGPLYIISGIGGNLLSAIDLIHRNKLHTISVGASGALFGLLGASLSELMTNWGNCGDSCLQLFSTLLIVAINIAIAIYNPWIDQEAHVGGFITGYLLGFILLMKPQPGYISPKYLPPGYYQVSRHKCHQYLFFVLALISFLALFASFLSMLEPEKNGWI